MSKKIANKFIVAVGAFSVIVAFSGTLISDGIKEAFLMAIFVGLLCAVIGAVGLRMFWKSE